MRVLGIDPGYDRLGWGIVEGNNHKFQTVSFNCITTEKNISMSKRLVILFDAINEILQKYMPDVLSVEDLFFNTNAKTAIAVGQARGVIMLAAEKKKIPVFSYSPLEIKMAITGYGRADKNQIQQMVKKILGLAKIPKPDDIADALAVGLTHSFAGKFRKNIEETSARYLYKT
jgi:crossover junction endodeoxyribonuclease RuvC